MYRRPYSIDHTISSKVYFEEFLTYLEDTVMAPGILLIAGNLNFHVDCHSNNNVMNFAEILQTYGLQQHIKVPTHKSRNTLDLIIPWSNSDITLSSPRAAAALSDHFFIECNLNIPQPNSTVKVSMTLFIILFERAFKMMNGVHFIVIALFAAELFKILIYAN